MNLTDTAAFCQSINLHLIDLRMVFVVVFLGLAFMFKGPVRNPFWEYCLLRESLLNKIIDRFRFFQDWGVFCDCSEYFYDVRIIALYAGERRVWFLRRDRDAAGLNLRSITTRITLTFYYKRNSFFMSPAILKSAQGLGNLISLEIQGVRCSSLNYNRDDAVVVDRFYYWKNELA